MDMAQLRVTLVKSPIGALPKHKRTVEALGLGKVNSSNIQRDNPAIRGMLRQVRHLVSVEEVEAEG
jgi:large subunit ribosomal protein L30